MTNFSRAALSLVAGCLLFTGAQAAPLPLLPDVTGETDIVLVQDAAPGEWRGYKGVRESRPGYRRGDDGWWYPLAAFAAGALIGGAASAAADNDAPPPEGHEPPPPQQAGRDRPDRLPPDHYAWCAKRYKSYRASDNSYIPRAGLRTQCISPFMR